MKHMRIALQYEPATMQDIVILSSEEETLETNSDEHEMTPESETVPETKEGLVDFYITAPVAKALSDVRGWSKIIVVCTALYAVFQLFSLATSLVQFSGAFAGLISILILCTGLVTNIITLWQSHQFNRTMDRALKFNDNQALAEAFRHQKLFFKWVFISIIASLGLALFQVIFLGVSSIL